MRPGSVMLERLRSVGLVEEGVVFSKRFLETPSLSRVWHSNSLELDHVIVPLYIELFGRKSENQLPQCEPLDLRTGVRLERLDL